MRKPAGVATLIAPIAFVLFLLTAGSASAQYREFTGKVDKKSKREIMVDNRMGDKLKFRRLKGTQVEGERSSWKEIKKDDWVIVHWKMMDNPRKAYRIIVTPPKDEAGEDL